MDVRDFLKNVSFSIQEKIVAFYQKIKTFVSATFKREYVTRDFIILFLFALLVGAALKSSVSEIITIGFQDYTLAPAEKLTDLNAVQKKVLREGGSLSLSKSATEGQACRQ